MKKGEYKNYRICSCCGKTLPLTRVYFKRLKTPQGEIGYHRMCKGCEAEKKVAKEWQEGKLLCHCCGEYKNIEEFSPNGMANPIRNNRRSICRECTTKRQKEHNRELQNDIKLNKCLRWRWLSARDRSRRNKNIAFSITLEDVVALWNKQNGKCALSGIEMTYELQKGRTPTNVSIDKIDRTKGYIPENIQLVCMACNQMKSDMSEEELYSFCKNIIKTYEDKHPDK